MTVAWLELRNAALGAIRRGWPVVPGTFLGADRHWHGRQDATGLGPILEDWQDNPVTDLEDARAIWSQHPYAVLLVCGQGVDALELPQRMMELLGALATGWPMVPVAVTGSPLRFLVFTATDSDFRLPAVRGMRLHGAGSWVALPPTPIDPVLVQRWWTTPLVGQPLLPTQMVCDALRSAEGGEGCDG